MEKITNSVGYLFSIFNGRKIPIDENSNYAPFMINRYIALADNYKFIELAEKLNRKLSNLSKEEHYEYVCNKINKGFYKVNFKNNFFSNAKIFSNYHKKLKPLVVKYGFKYEDIYFLLNILSDKEYDKLDKILDKLNESK